MSPTPRNSRPKGPRVSGEAFRRVDDEVWSKEIIEGLEDNSCKLHYPLSMLDIINVIKFSVLSIIITFAMITKISGPLSCTSVATLATMRTQICTLL
jgi:hypothetical protein